MRLPASIGGTPFLLLPRISAQAGASIWVKRESANPGGSIKDRVARNMINGCRIRGAIHEGTTIVEPTSGNTGIGLAMLCAVEGLNLVLTMPESMSVERRALLGAYGAEIVLTPAGEGMAGAVEAAHSIVSSRNAILLDQFSNPDNVEAHYTTTGPEIFTQSRGLVDVFLAGVGTGGTLVGTGRFLRERIPGVMLYAVEPAESPVLSGGSPGAHGIQGIGAGFVPNNYDASLPNDVLTVSTDDAVEMARRLFRDEGISSGISGGANVAAAVMLAGTPGFEGKHIVTVLPDTGERYLSTAMFTA